MKIEIWNGCGFAGGIGSTIAPYPPQTIEAIDEKGGFFLYQHSEDWFELFKDGNRILSAMWTQEMAEEYRDRLIAGENCIGLQREIDRNYKTLCGKEDGSTARLFIGTMYGDRSDSERYSDEELAAKEQEVAIVPEPVEAAKTRKKRR